MSVSISWFVIGIIYNLLYCHLFLKLTNSNEQLFNKKSIIFSLLFSLLNCYIISNGIAVRPIIVNVCYILILYVSYKIPLSKSTIIVLILSLIFSIGEMITGIVLSTVFKINLVEFNQTALGAIVCSTGCVIFVIIVLFSKKVREMLNSTLKWCTDNKTFKTFSLSILVIMTLSILLKQSILYWNSFSNLLVINSFIICILVFAALYFKENSDRNKLAHQYDKLLGHVQVYENLIIEKSKDQHEYKNQLIMLRGLIDKKNKKAIEYVNELLDINNKEINYNWLTRLNNIPSGGLKGLIYYKVSQMQEKGIEVYIDISKDLGQESIWGTCDQYLRDISRVIGVYIDNAIEASIHANKKYIILEAELADENIIFSFSNTYAGSVDVINIDNPGFSTKGKGKGYGLSLVKDIISRNDCLEQQREINGIYYVQKLIIKRKNG